MRQDQSDTEKNLEIRKFQNIGRPNQLSDFVFEKSIFNNVFEKDIRRVYLYKKAERLGKAIHLITPAFVESLSLKNRLDGIAVSLVDAATLPPQAARTILSRDLLSLSSLLSMARTGGLLSPMNADLIAREAQLLLQEVASYEEPRLHLEDTPSLATLSRAVPTKDVQLKELPKRSSHAQEKLKDK